MAYLTIPRWEEIPFLIHGFGTAKWKEGDFKKQKGWKDFKLVFLKQVHSDVVHFVDEIPKGNLKGDALITRLPHLFLIIKTADCLPVLIVDERKHIIAAVHCGWRGTQKKLIKRVIQGFEVRYGCDPQRLLVGLGPCIGGACYEVGEDVKQSFEEGAFPRHFFQNHPSREGKFIFDLRKANMFLLKNQGIKEENIFVLDICTHCEKNFHSYRRDREKVGRNFSFIALSF